MKKHLTKLIALMTVLTLAISNSTTAFAYFGPSNNQANTSASYTGQAVVPSDISSNASNKLIVTLPDADLTAAAGGTITDGDATMLVDTIAYDNTAKTVTYTFTDALHAGHMLLFSFDNVVSPAGSHPYKIELYSGETSTAVELESGSYTIADGGVLVNLTVGQYLNFGLTTDTLNMDLDYIGSQTKIGRDIHWNISTNAQNYSVSAKLKSEFSNGSHMFPYSIPDGMGTFISQENMKYVTGVFIGNFAPGDQRGNDLLENSYTPIKTTGSVLLTTGNGTNGDSDKATLSICADGHTISGNYTGVVEFTVTASF